MRSAGTIDAVVVAGGTATLIVSAPVAGAFAFVSLIVSGEQLMPGKGWHVTVPMPVNPVGVTVIVEVPVPPAVAIALEPEMVKLGCTTVTPVFLGAFVGA